MYKYLLYIYETNEQHTQNINLTRFACVNWPMFRNTLCKNVIIYRRWACPRTDDSVFTLKSSASSLQTVGIGRSQCIVVLQTSTAWNATRCARLYVPRMHRDETRGTSKVTTLWRATHTYTQIQSDDAFTRLVTMGYHVSPRCTFCNNSKGAIHANHASQTHESSSGHRHFARKQDITVYWRDYCQLCMTRHYTRCGGRKTTPSSSVNKHLYDKMLILGTRTADKRAPCMTLGRMDVAVCCFVEAQRRIHWHFTSLGTYR